MPNKFETPTALPKLVRYMPVELIAIRKGKRKPSAASVREELAAFSIEDPEARHAWRRLVKLAKRLNVPIEDAKSEELKAWRAAAEAEPDPDDLDEEEELEDERDDDTFEMSFSSETPVPRWFGNEILDHKPESIDLSRASQGLAYLVDHDTGDQVGIIRNFRIEDGKTRGEVNFSRSQRGQDIK